MMARLLHAIAGWFEHRASAKDLEARIVVLEQSHAQLRTDMAKCKFMVGLNQITEVTANDV
jgi:hypothetical protein